MRYMIHSIPFRSWYVEKFLIPSMIDQGIKESDIKVWCDADGRGNLFACMDSFLWCGQNTDGGTWHLQDDIIISRDFAEKTKTYNKGIVCGAVVKDWGPDYTKTGLVTVRDLWYSFPCIRIPDHIAGECAGWFFSDASKRSDPTYRNRILRKKHDDDFFRFFLLENHPELMIQNLAPNIIDHIDYLIGGSIVNQDRERQINRVAYWNDEKLIRELEDRLEIYFQTHEFPNDN